MGTVMTSVALLIPFKLGQVLQEGIKGVKVSRACCQRKVIAQSWNQTGSEKLN